MEIIVGAIIFKDNKILMVKELKKECKNKWAFPAGHLEEGETMHEGAKRETLEETGCKIDLKKAFPILVKNTGERTFLMVHFLSNIIEETSEYKKDEIQETRWFTIDEIKKMEEHEFRSYKIVTNIIHALENQEMYDLGIIKNLSNF